MKYLLMLAMGMIVVNYSYAQKYLHDTSVYRFEGTWVYSHNSQDFKIILAVRQRSVEKLDITIDMLAGQYNYKINNKIIVNTIDSSKFFISHGYIENRKKTLNKVRLTFWDAVKQKSGVGHLEFLPGKGEKVLLWTLRNGEVYIIGDYNKDFDPTFSVPTRLILHKVE